MNETLAELTISRVKGVLCTAMTLKDKALILEKEIGLEPFYAMLSMGQSLESLAESVGFTPFELEYMLKRTPNHRRQFMNAKTNQLAEQSTDTLEHFETALMLDTEQAAAAKHHATMLEKSLKVLNNPAATQGSGGVVVNNTVVIRDKDDVPPLPDGLDQIIDVEE